MKNAILLFSFFSLALSLGLGCSSVNPNDIATWPSYQVHTVLSGDTVILENGETVAYFRIRAPQEKELFFQDSKAENEKLVLGNNIHIHDAPFSKDKEGLFYHDGRITRDERGIRRVYAFLPQK